MRTTTAGHLGEEALIDLMDGAGDAEARSHAASCLHCRARLEQAASKSDKRAILRDSRQQQQAFNSQVENLLSPSQVTRWRDLRAETRDRIKEHYEEKRESGN